jgi:hypothetical protein
MKPTKLAVLTAVTLFVFSFMFSSCKNCNGNKGRDNGNSNDEDKDNGKDNCKNNSVIGRDEDQDNGQNQDGSVGMTAERKVAQLAELEKKAQLIEADTMKLQEDAHWAMNILFRAENDESLFYDAIAALKTIDNTFTACDVAFNSVMYIQGEMCKNVVEAEINNKAYETVGNIITTVHTNMNQILAQKILAHTIMECIRTKWSRS